LPGCQQGPNRFSSGFFSHCVSTFTALESLKGAKVFAGARGGPPADSDALAEMAARLSWLAYDLRNDIAELDLIP
jgi:hypothetical protein